MNADHGRVGAYGSGWYRIPDSWNPDQLTLPFFLWTRAAVRDLIDGHPVHRATTVKTWLARHPEQLALFFLPSYSPELNPDELLNQDVKTNALGRRRPSSLPQLSGETRAYLRRRQRQPTVVIRYFDEEHVRYAAAH